MGFVGKKVDMGTNGDLSMEVYGDMGCTEKIALGQDSGSDEKEKKDAKKKDKKGDKKSREKKDAKKEDKKDKEKKEGKTDGKNDKKEDMKYPPGSVQQFDVSINSSIQHFTSTLVVTSRINLMLVLCLCSGVPPVLYVLAWLYICEIS